MARTRPGAGTRWHYAKGNTVDKNRAVKIWVIIAGWFNEQGTWTPPEAWGLFDHTHEGLSEGAWSLASEGYLDPEWAIIAAQSEELCARVGKDVMLEPIYGCVLGIYEDPNPIY